ncbi:DUF4159 domain-containing protein [Acidisoma sp. C75]
MILAAPWLLLGLLALPLLWWLVRASPPAPRRQSFPALHLLMGLEARSESPERTPPWLLLLRLLALACLILGFANPILHPARGTAGRGPLLLVLDDSWSTAPDWAARAAAAHDAIVTAGRQGRAVALLPTAPSADGHPPAIQGPMPAAAAAARLAALAPLPWPPDRAADRRALAGWHAPGTALLFIDDGLRAGPGEAPFRAALAASARAAGGTVTDLRAAAPPLLLRPPALVDGRLDLHIETLPLGRPRRLTLLAEGADGRVLGSVGATIAAGAAKAAARLALPVALANTVTTLRLAGDPGAGRTFLMDGEWRRRVVGLVSAAGPAADAPLVGPLYYLNRALGPDVDLRHGSLAAVLAQPLSALILSDQPLPAGAEQDAVRRFVERGGLLIRFAGPRMAETPDPLLPVRLLAQDRSLGGALSWNQPEPLAPFPPESPFAGLAVPADVTVKRQLLADPASLGGAAIWASLRDGTPLVSSAPLGRGRIVLFHVTADADWSSLPLSGLFPAMLDRLIRLSSGLALSDGTARLPPLSLLDGYGSLNPPAGAASPLAAADFAHAVIGPRHPPGFYGRAEDRRALNLGSLLPPLEAAPPVSGARVEAIGAGMRERALGPDLVAAALILLLLDLAASLLLRGALRRPAGRGPLGAPKRPPLALLALCLGLGAAAAVPAGRAHAAQRAVPRAALQTTLAYVVTGNGAVDQLSRDGLASLANFVTSRSAAILGPPVGVVPGKDDLSFYPLLYWPVIPGDAPLGAAAIAALNSFMANGGILLIDTEGNDSGDAGTGAGLQPGAEAALRQAVQGLEVPPLAPLDTRHVLSHSFYLLRSFPGRYVGAPVWVARNPEAGNDDVSPIIIGANDWVAAWDMASDGTFPYGTLPGGDEQRLYAYRFGMNLVMYALTGTYKADQVHVPAILQRMGQ